MRDGLKERLCIAKGGVTPSDAAFDFVGDSQLFGVAFVAKLGGDAVLWEMGIV